MVKRPAPGGRRFEHQRRDPARGFAGRRRHRLRRHPARDETAEQEKPVLISMSDLAASGGYFIAMTGDPVLAYSNTLTGSIGVFFGKINLSGLYDKIGIKKELLTRGRFAAIDSEAKPLTPEEKDKVQKEIQVFYRGFVERVAEARKRPYDQVEPLAQGRVWLGAQAKMNGLVDEIGGLDRAVEMIKQRTNIPASEQVTLVTYPPRRTLPKCSSRARVTPPSSNPRFGRSPDLCPEIASARRRATADAVLADCEVMSEITNIDCIRYYHSGNFYIFQKSKPEILKSSFLRSLNLQR